jgi:hypothetical protein
MYKTNWGKSGHRYGKSIYGRIEKTGSFVIR